MFQPLTDDDLSEDIDSLRSQVEGLSRGREIAASSESSNYFPTSQIAAAATSTSSGGWRSTAALVLDVAQELQELAVDGGDGPSSATHAHFRQGAVARALARIEPQARV
ncbi:MAG TPA: hypothetical protein VHN14_10885 [Kofleriaceae bacterium]|nr:hypothetical protein [Kofleriaceae bacterium]